MQLICLPIIVDKANIHKKEQYGPFFKLEIVLSFTDLTISVESNELNLFWYKQREHILLNLNKHYCDLSNTLKAQGADNKIWNSRITQWM